MALVKVWNDNKYPFKQIFQDEEIEIDAGKYIVMEQHKANAFKGTFHPIKVDAQKRPDPRFFKMIRIEPHDGTAVEEKPKFICQYDGKEFATEKELETYIDQNHLDKVNDQEFAEKRRRGRTKQQ